MTVRTSPTQDETRFVWDRRIIHGAQLVDDGNERIFPPIATLKQVWEDSDKSWLQSWLDSDGDDGDDIGD